MPLETSRLLLRSFVPGDAPVIQRELSRVEMARMLAIPYPYPEGAAREWIRTSASSTDYAITLCETGELIGAVNLTVSQQHRRGTLGYWCAIDLWGRGYATEALRAVISHSFTQLGVEKVYAECHGDNPASRRVLEKSGLTLEGRLRRHSFRVDRYADKLLYGALRDEWARPDGAAAAEDASANAQPAHRSRSV